MKRLLLALLAAGMLLPQSSFAAEPGAVRDYADVEDVEDVNYVDYGFAPSSVSVDEKALEQAILTVKSRVNIPDDYETFNFSSGVQYGATVYHLSWSRNEDGANISVNIGGNIITGYYKYNDSNSKGGALSHISLISKKNLYVKACELAKKLNPGIYSDMKIDESSFSAYINSQNCNFNISRVENGVNVWGNGGTITLNKDTGELINFNLSWVNGAKFKETKGALSQKQAKESYTKNIGLTPVYRVITDYEAKTQKAVLLYLPKSEERIDAFTGKISSFEPNFYGGYAAEDDFAANEDAGSPSVVRGDTAKLTPAELSAVEKEKGLISLEQAASKITGDKYNAFPADSKISSASLTQDYYYNQEEYCWNIGFTNGSALINAKTGGILSYNYYEIRDYASKIDSAAVGKNADAALRTYLGGKFGEFKAEDKNINQSGGEKNVPVQIYGMSFSYNRYVNNIKVESDSIWIRTNPNGLITSFYYTYSNVSFPSDSKMLTEKKALEKLYAGMDLDLSYFINISDKNVITTALLYQMPYFTVDAFTGDTVDFRGDKIAADDRGGYSDINSHSIKNIALKLYENGITLPAVNGKLMPDSNISETDLIQLVNSVCTNWEDFYSLYTYRIYNKKTAVSITRRDAVKCFITALGGKKFAEITKLYASPFADIKKNDRDVGFFALANAMGIISPNSKGGINPEAKLTRAQALRMVYGYLSLNTENAKNS